MASMAGKLGKIVIAAPRVMFLQFSTSTRRTHTVLTIGGLREVNVGIAQRPPGAVVAANADRRDGPDGAELLVQIGLGDIVSQVSDVQGRGMEVHVAGIHLAAGSIVRAHTIL